MSVQLIIKSAAQSVDDFKLNCEMDWTIAQVKDEITAVYPTKPAKEHQKLIYGGKLLPDHLPLTSILNPSHDIHTIHLVCPFEAKSETGKSKPNKEKNSSSTCTVPPVNTDGIYPHQLSSPPIFTNPVPLIPGAVTGDGPTDAFNQYLAMQQMYSQFMRQYLSQYNIAAPYGQVPVNVNPVQQQIPQPVAPQQNINQNVDARAPPAWDTIDFLYLMCRASMLFLLLVYYSSLPRIFAVLIMVLFLTILAKLNRERQQALRIRAERRAATVRQSEENNALQEAEEERTVNPETENETTPNESSSVPTAPQIQRKPSIFLTIISAIASFFTSLIPDDPLPVNAN